MQENQYVTLFKQNATAMLLQSHLSELSANFIEWQKKNLIHL